MVGFVCVCWWFGMVLCCLGVFAGLDFGLGLGSVEFRVCFGCGGLIACGAFTLWGFGGLQGACFVVV